MNLKEPLHDLWGGLVHQLSIFTGVSVRRVQLTRSEIARDKIRDAKKGLWILANDAMGRKHLQKTFPCKITPEFTEDNRTSVSEGAGRNQRRALS